MQRWHQQLKDRENVPCPLNETLAVDVNIKKLLLALKSY